MQILEDFLYSMESIFVIGSNNRHGRIIRAETIWDGEKSYSTGRFLLGWDSETQEAITTDVVPEIFYAPLEDDFTGWGEWGFFNRDGRIYDAPWLNINEWEDMYGQIRRQYHYANYFWLFDFDGSGIPVVFVHMNQDFDGGYAGFYRVYKFADGEYRQLEMRLFIDGEQWQREWAEERQPWIPGPWIGWLGSSQHLFMDELGRIIAFTNDAHYRGIARYLHMTFSDEYLDFHLIAQMGEGEYDAWMEHHWSVWDQYGRGELDGWLNHSPTIFGTDISITLIESLVDLEEEMMELILNRFIVN